MGFLRSMDLYKVVILLSLVLLPAVGWYCMKLDEDIAASRKAIDEAKRPNGLLEQIGSLQKKVEVVVQNKLSTTDTINMPRRYFEGQILQAGGANLKTSDFGLTDPKEEPVTLTGTKQRASDFVVDVTWPRTDFAQPLDFVYAVIFNCESGAGAGGMGAGQSIWKLRDLQLVNATEERLMATHKTPPPELSDRWTIKEMKFARREPRKGN